MAELGELQMQERKVGKRGGEENVGFEASEGDDGSASGRREEEVAQMGYGSIQGLQVGKVEEVKEEGEERQKWSNPIEFLLSCIAMSVGLGNVWRFPYTAYENGGGAFLIPYIIVLMLIGRPLYFMELVMGQFSSASSVKVWNMVPGLRGVGFGQMIGTASVVSYYCVLIALSLHYLGSSCQALRK